MPKERGVQRFALLDTCTQSWNILLKVMWIFYHFIYLFNDDSSSDYVGSKYSTSIVINQMPTHKIHEYYIFFMCDVFVINANSSIQALLASLCMYV
jgi:hypothetical protein